MAVTEGIAMRENEKGMVLQGSQLSSVNLWQKISQWWYGVAEPHIIRFSDFMLRNEQRKKIYIKMKKPKALPSGVILSTEAACRLVDFLYADQCVNDTARMAVTDCVCQTALKQFKEPHLKDMALLYAADMYTTWEHTGIKEKFNRIEEAEQAKEMLRGFHKAGLLHNALYCHQSGKWTFVLCNCDNEICVPFRSYMAGRKGEIGAGPEIIKYDLELCIGVEDCGHCLTRCVLEACAVKNGQVVTDLEKCLGCGLCVSTCEGNARHLVPREDYQHEDVLTTKILLGDPVE
jgi:NAD-dependent dihydropyrimidine dehydrogenase PreA subunit